MKFHVILIEGGFILIPEYYEFYNPVKIISGKGAVANITDELRQLDTNKALLITDKGIQKAGLVQKVVDAFDNSNVKLAGVFDDVPQDSSMKVINHIASLYRKERCDALIAIGGGSVLDTTKAVNIVASYNDEDIHKYLGMDNLEKPLNNFIAIPTTAGTGSEVTSACVIYDPDKDMKMTITSPFVYPNTAIIDPEMMMSMPPKITAATGMDALTHAIEAYTSLQKNPLSDAYSLSAVKMVFSYLTKAVENGRDEQARLIMANAATLAGISFSNAMVGVVHSVGHALGGVCHLPHGIANSIALPFGMKYNIDVASHLYAEIFRYVFLFEKADSDTIDAERLIEKVIGLRQSLNKICGLPVTLKEAGISKDKLREVSANALLDGTTVYNPKQITEDDFMSILEKAYE